MKITLNDFKHHCMYMHMTHYIICIRTKSYIQYVHYGTYVHRCIYRKHHKFCCTRLSDSLGFIKIWKKLHSSVFKKCHSQTLRGKCFYQNLQSFQTVKLLLFIILGPLYMHVHCLKVQINLYVVKFIMLP